MPPLSHIRIVGDHSDPVWQLDRSMTFCSGLVLPLFGNDANRTFSNSASWSSLSVLRYFRSIPARILSSFSNARRFTSAKVSIARRNVRDQHPSMAGLQIQWGKGTPRVDDFLTAVSGAGLEAARLRSRGINTSDPHLHIIVTQSENDTQCSP